MSEDKPITAVDCQLHDMIRGIQAQDYDATFKALRSWFEQRKIVANLCCETVSMESHRQGREAIEFMNNEIRKAFLL